MRAALRRSSLLLLACFVVAAQTFDRARPPAPSEPRPYKLPPVFETSLPNGLTVVMVDDGRIPLVTLRLAFRCGNRRDPKDLPGLTAIVADLLTQGTKNHGFIQIAETVDSMGASLSAASGADFLAINGSVQPDQLAALLEIVADAARNAEFSEIDLRLQKQNRRQALARQYAQPAFAASAKFREVLFGAHPYAHLGPTVASLEKMNRQALLDYRDTWLVPNNAFLIMVGRLPARADAMKIVTERLGTWERRSLPEPVRAPLPPAAARVILVDRPGAVQADVRMGKIAATQRDPDYFAEIAGATIVGSVPIGRMFLDLREKRALTYDIRADPLAFDEAGILSFSTQVRNEVAGEAIRAMLDHLDRMAAEPVTDKELADAKGAAAGSFLLRLEPQAGLADELMVGRIQGLAANYLETWRPRMEAVKPDEIQAAARKFMSTRDSVVVVVGDAAKIQDSLAAALSKIGKLEVVKSVP